MKRKQIIMGTAILLATLVLVGASIPHVRGADATTSGSGSSRDAWLYNSTNLKVIVDAPEYIGLDVSSGYFNVTVQWIVLDSAHTPDEQFTVYVEIQDINKTAVKTIDWDGTNADTEIAFDLDYFAEQDTAKYNVTLDNNTASIQTLSLTTDIITSSMTGMILGIMPVMITIAIISFVLSMVATMSKDGFGGK